MCRNNSRNHENTRSKLIRELVHAPYPDDIYIIDPSILDNCLLAFKIKTVQVDNPFKSNKERSEVYIAWLLL